MLIHVNELINLYKEAEITRLKVFSILSRVELGCGEAEEVPHYKEFMDDFIRIEESDKHIKITVKDVLPRNASLPKTTLAEHWFGIMHYAFGKTAKRFDKPLCVIKVCHPDVYWDVDNRAYQIIINSLRYNKMVSNDQHAHVSFMVIGERDHDHPRTEIYLLEHPADPVKMLL